MKTFHPNDNDLSSEKSAFYRARSQLKELIFFGADDTTKHLTLTFKKACMDREHVRSCLDAMCRRYAADYGHPLPYISTLELHPGGHGYHIHMLINSPYIDQAVWQDSLWQQGIIHIEAFDAFESIPNFILMSDYMSKYWLKSSTEVPKGSRRYSKSKAWPKVPDTERLDFETKEEALAFQQEQAHRPGAFSVTRVHKISTGEEVSVLYANTPTDQESSKNPGLNPQPA